MARKTIKELEEQVITLNTTLAEANDRYMKAENKLKDTQKELDFCKQAVEKALNDIEVFKTIRMPLDCEEEIDKRLASDLPAVPSDAARLLGVLEDTLSGALRGSSIFRKMYTAPTLGGLFKHAND
jgi:chromosome segregation ATPase